MNKTKKRNNKNKHKCHYSKHNYSKRNHYNSTRPLKHNYSYKNTNTNTRKKQKGGLNLFSSDYSPLKDEQAERNTELKMLISSKWLEEYENVIPVINEYKNKYKQMWTSVLITEKGELKGKNIIKLDEDRQFIQKVGDYFSDTFVKPNTNNNIIQILQDPNVLSKMCKQIMYETSSEEKTDCKTIIEGLINLNFKILQLEIKATEKVLETIILEQDKEFELWVEEERKEQEKNLNKMISDELTKEITTQNWQQTLRQFKEFKKRKANIDFKPENNELEKRVLAESEKMKQIFASFKSKYPNYMSYKNLANILTKLNLTIEMYTNLIKEDDVFWRDPSLTYYESNKKIYLRNIQVCLEEFATIITDIVNGDIVIKNYEESKIIIEKYSKEVKDRLDADLKYITTQIQLTNLIKDVTFLYTQSLQNEILIKTYSSNQNYNIYKEIINKLSLNITLELYTDYLSNIEKRQEFNKILDSRIEKIQKDIIQIYSIISDARKKEKIAEEELKPNVKPQDIDLLKVKQKILEEKINIKINKEKKRDEQYEGEEKGEYLDSVGPSLTSNKSIESLNSLKSKLSNITIEPNMIRSKFTEIKNKLKNINKVLNSELKYTNLFLSSSSSDYNELDEITNVINSTGLQQPPAQKLTKLTSLTQTMSGLLNSLSKLKPDSNPLYSEKSTAATTATKPRLLKEIQEGIIERQDRKIKEIARLEHNLRHVNSELKLTKEKYKDNKLRDIFEEELRKKQLIIESDLNISKRELDSLTHQSKAIVDKPDILRDIKERNEIIIKKQEDARKSAITVANEIKMAERQKQIEDKQKFIADLIRKITQISPDQPYNKQNMLENVDKMLAKTQNVKAQELLEEAKKIINGKDTELNEFKKSYGKLDFHSSMIKTPQVTISPVTTIKNTSVTNFKNIASTVNLQAIPSTRNLQLTNEYKERENQMKRQILDETNAQATPRTKAESDERIRRELKVREEKKQKLIQLQQQINQAEIKNKRKNNKPVT